MRYINLRLTFLLTEIITITPAVMRPQTDPDNTTFVRAFYRQVAMAT